MSNYKKPLKKDDSPKIVCQNKQCPKMGKYQSINDFYKSHSNALPHHPFCKTCVNEMVDINNMNTIYDILKVLDTPFILDVWNQVCLSGTKNYLGDYLKIMNFTKKNLYGELKWVDSIFELSIEQEEVSEEVQKELDDTPIWDAKWQGNYTKMELEYLNGYLTDLENDFKIVTRNHKDYAMKIAQASLAMNKSYNDMMTGKADAEKQYKSAASNFDTLSKSAQFAESQRGANDVSLGCFGKVFDAVEKHNWVPEYNPEDKDMYDKLLEQFANIEKSL